MTLLLTAAEWDSFLSRRVRIVVEISLDRFGTFEGTLDRTPTDLGDFRLVDVRRIDRDVPVVPARRFNCLALRSLELV